MSEPQSQADAAVGPVIVRWTVAALAVGVALKSILNGKSISFYANRSPQSGMRALNPAFSSAVFCFRPSLYVQR